MNRPKAAAVRRPSAVPKPSAHPPPGDFIALGSKGQSGEGKAAVTLLKPAPPGLPSERKRDAAAALAGPAGLPGLTKRPKLSSTPPLSALGRLAEAAVAEKRAISPSIKEPSVIPIEVVPTVLLDEIEAAEAEGNDDRIEGVLCGAVKQLKMNRAKPDTTLYLSLMYLAKIKPNIFATEGVIEALCSLLRRDASINFKAKGNSLVSVLACNLLMAAYEEDENWPEIFVKVYIEDSLGERIWVDSPHCKTFVDNIQTAFNTKMPPKTMLLHGEVGRSGGDLSAGSSPHPSMTEEEDSQSELLIAEEKMSPEQAGQLMPRYEDLAESVEEYVLDMLRDQLNRRQPMDNVSRNLLRLLTATCGYKEVRQMAVQRLEMWLQNPKLTKPAQDLLMSVCMNCNTHSSEDMEVISNLIKIRLKPKVLLNHYMLCIRELLNAHRDNLGTTIKFVIFNELSNARNPNNMQILYTVLQHSSEQAPKYLAMVFQDLLTTKDDYLRASRALLREIIKQTKHEINFQAFCLGLMQERKEALYAEMEFKERFVIHITDLLAVSMMLGITAQVKEAGIAWDKGEKKNLEVLRSFQNQIAAIQRDAVWWLHTVVPSISKLAPKDYVHCLHKVLFTEQPETYYKWDNWPPESDRNFFLRLCSEVPILEDTLMRILVIGLSRDLPLGPADAMELADHLVKRAAAVQADDVEVLRVERIQLIDAVLNLCTYHHPENIQLPPGYQPPNLAISTLYWKAWPLLLVVAAFNPENIGLAAWEEYPSLKMLMEMVMTNNYSYPQCTLTDEETRTEMINRELQISQREKQEILAFEGHLAAASTKQTITESSSLLLSQLTSLDPQGPPRRPPPHVLEQVKSLNQSLRLGHLLCRSRHPDFLLNIIQRQASSQSMPWLADLVQSSEGSLDVLPVQCLCEFLLHDAADESTSGEEEEEGESKDQRAKKRQRQQKQRQLLGRLQDLLLGPKADEQTTCEVLDYFLRRLSSSQVASRVLAMKGLSLVLSEGGMRDGEEKDHPMEEDSGDSELLQGYQWLLRDLPRLPLFDSVRATTALALQQAIHMETDPQTISAYLVYLSQHAPVEEQGQHNDLALDVARLIVERSTIMSHLFSKLSYSAESDAVLVALLSIFSRYIKRMRQSKEGEEVYSWSESQDQVFLRWTSGETATMHILVVHAMVILLTLGPPQAGDGDFYTLLDIWFPEKKPLPTAFLVDTSEEALLLPDWLKLRMIRSEVPRLVDAALQDLEPQQLLLFVQSFGIPVSSMSKLLQYLDQAVSHDPQTLEQNIMDKNYMAHLVEVQHERGATGGQTFHSLLTASLPARRDSAETARSKSSPENSQSQSRIRALSQVRVLGPEDDLAGIFLQLFPLTPDPRWQNSSLRPLALALQQALGQELAHIRQGAAPASGMAASGITASGMAASGITVSGMAASRMAASGITANGMAASGITVSGMAASGMAASGMAVSGMAASGITASGITASGMAASGITASGMAASGITASGITASGMAANGITASGITASGIAASGMAASGITASGMAANGIAASGMAASGITASGITASGMAASGITASGIAVSGMAARLLQAVAALLNSAHSGALVMAMHRHHFISCPLMRQLYQYHRSMPQDTAFSSLFFKVLMQMLQWLENPAVEDGPLRAQLKAFAVQYSSRHRISDVRGGFLHLTEALSFRRDPDLISSTVCAIIATLKSGEKCNVEPELISKVLQGLIETHSPYLEELLTVLFSATVETTARCPAMKPIAVVCSLLLQDKEETPVKKEVESCSAESAWPGPASGLLNDWLEMLDLEVISSCPDLQQKLLFSWNKAGSQVPSFRPYLLALLTHQSSWTTLHQCIRLLLGRNREQRFDPTASLDFLWACIHIPRIWQGRDQRTPQKRREEFVLHLKASELISMVELILAEAETRYQNTDEASCTLIQSRLPLLLSCSHGDLENIKKVTEYLTSCIQQWGSSSVGKCCQDLLLQIYLQLPELLVPMPEMLLTSEGARDSSTCKLDALVHRFINLLADTSDSKSSESRVWDANMACRKLAVAHPILLLRHLPMIAALLHGRVHLNFQEFRQQNHLTFFIHVLGILELLQPQVFQNEHQAALWDCLLSFIRLLLNYRKSSRHLAAFISKFVQFIHKYITCNAQAAVSFLQKHSDPLHDLSSDNSDLAMLKSLLAGLSLPSKSGLLDRGSDEEKDDEAAAGSLPLVSVSLFTPLTPAEMAPYMKRLSRGQTVEDILEVLTDIDEMSRRRPEILAFFATNLQKLMSSSEDSCRNLAFSLALRSIQNNPSIAADFLPTYMYCLGSRDFEVVQTALRNLPEYTLLCQEHAAVLLHRAFLVGMYGQIDTSSQISEALKILHMEAMI
ncbi:integrator complex subunit 1 isoform X1 [Corvus hawaiiensis]|uniref:integrator complex subunit 1 isoform X1 n=1 Tax=Corvus hawaiiensis TaxID=134902 RepID=UPI00201944FC|nr:integrator complex subunit 1 isoform X1 [Corvus hawaiiensis]